MYPVSANVVFKKEVQCRCTEWMLYRRWRLFI